LTFTKNEIHILALVMFSFMVNSTIHEGENLRKIRLVMGLTQSLLAQKLGEGWNQQRVSYLENRRKIDISTLDTIVAALQIPVWLLQMPQQVFNYIIFKNPNHGISCSEIHIIKIVELYERLLISERERYQLSNET